jgi:hypothetical protein
MNLVSTSVTVVSSIRIIQTLPALVEYSVMYERDGEGTTAAVAGGVISGTLTTGETGNGAIGDAGAAGGSGGAGRIGGGGGAAI